jgi:RimJ/RimL family protein N-acetyltransferase
MRHKIVIEGFAYRLRPIADKDAEFIIKLRCDPELNRFLHSTSVSLYSQLDWLAKYYARPGDWYFVLERRYDSISEGLSSLYDLDAQQCIAEWGRWILRKDSLAAVESAWLIYRCAFELLSLRQVYCQTVAENESVVSFHDSCGITERSLIPNHFNLDGRKLDAVEHRVNDAAWKTLAPRLEHLAKKMARRLKRDA